MTRHSSRFALLVAAALVAGVVSAAHAGPEPSSDPRSQFTAALQAGRFDEAERSAQAMLARNGWTTVLLDELTFKMSQAGATQQAVSVLLAAFPFRSGTPVERERLVTRLTVLAEQQQAVLTERALAVLRAPLDTPALRSRQATMWANLQRCDAVRAVLGDMSADYAHDDWMRLGDCSAPEDPALAQRAYAQADALQPGSRATRALAYQAFANGDYQVAVAAWRRVVPQTLSVEDWMGAATTAVAAGAHAQAASWLEGYRASGGTLDRRYWLLVADAHPSDRAVVTRALHQAIDLEPHAEDYVRLAQVNQEAAPAQRVKWLEQAAALAPSQADVHMELGYAYLRDGQRTTDAQRAFARAAVLDPQSVTAALELGYASWEIGQPRQAERALERAWQLSPGNLGAARQLVYVHQQLGHNTRARWFAERVLDASPETSAREAESRFGLQRLHEDLGRRVTVNVDAFSGTHVGTNAATSQPGRGYRSYSQAEADVRLLPIRNGRTISAYARVFADSGDARRAMPSQNAMFGVGLRWKPLRSQVIYFAAEHQRAVEDDRPSDVMLRVSASFLNGGRFGDDWHPTGGGWFAQNLYLDGAHYLEGERSAMTADYRTSYHAKVGSSQTFEPFGHVQVNGFRQDRVERDARVGAGVRWNVWYGATRYDASPHKLSLGVEFQQAFETYLVDKNGVFVTMGVRW